MELKRLRLENFRQFAETEIELGPGITGIIGPNGAGKSTLLEAIAWAIYGVQAVRGDKDSIRRHGAPGRSRVEVTLDFALGPHEYSVTRNLYGAELRQDGQVVANSLKSVSERLGRVLGMSHDEFFNTYFTGQKELAVMSALGKVERAAFLSRVLGYERLELAQQRVREVRNGLSAELKGLEAGLPDKRQLEADRAAALERLARSRAAAEAAREARRKAEDALAREQPKWKEWEVRRDRIRSLESERAMAQHAVESARQDFQRLDRELAEALAARTELERLGTELKPLKKLQAERTRLEGLQQEAAERQAAQAQLTELERTAAARDKRIAELEGAAAASARAEREVKKIAEQLLAFERKVEEQRATWARDRQDAETKRQQLREQYRDVKEQRDRIDKLGPEGACPTCQRPLGKEYEAVLGLLDRQLEEITLNGNFFKQRAQQLTEPPEPVVEAERERDAARDVSRTATEHAGELKAQAEERTRAMAERDEEAPRLAELKTRLATKPSRYDAARLDAVRAELTALEPLVQEAAALEARARLAQTLVKEAEQAEQLLSRREQQVKQLVQAIAADGFSEEKFRQAKERYDRSVVVVREAELAAVEAGGELTRSEEVVAEVDRRIAERGTREQHIDTLKGKRRLHDELDRAYSELRAELNAAMRPEIAELASGFLSDLTDGRYDTADLSEDYTLTVVDSGVPKPVISGGEEDLTNLVLRLAISQMIAERAGQPLSLLVLDEVFGSLDEGRRQHVLGLLRQIGDRFPQVIIITHIDQIREGLDRVIRVEYDGARGVSGVRDETATLGAGGVDAGVAA
ncbi:MAG TPA: SMC family ATPase [Gemmatimonadales bacterium]|nr:SMC family ATPase [Gemmatimonadales bacterium]